MDDKGINVKDRDFILYATPSKVGKSLISYIDQIDYLRKVNQRLEKELRMILDNEYGMEKEQIDKHINLVIKGEWDKE